MIFWVTETFRKRRLEDGKSFYCPNGHSMNYDGEAPKLERELSAAKNRAEYNYTRAEQAERSNSALRGVITRMRKHKK